MKTLRYLWMALVVLIAGCGGDGDSASAPETTLSNRLYVLAGQGGHADVARPGADYAVTLTNVGPELDWYTDKPDRVTGTASTRHFVDTDWQRVYGDVAPNALLQYQNATGLHGLFGSVHDMAYSEGTGTLRFRLRLAEATTDVGPSVGAFDSPVLTLLNNIAPPAEASTFALAAGQSALVADGLGGFRLNLTQVDDDVFWMNNAPSRAGDFESLGRFVNAWPDRFAQVLPNASLAGDPGDGDYQIVPLTLSDPVYDAASGNLSFAVTPLRGAGVPDPGTALRNAVLFIDSGARGTPSGVFAQTWRGVDYSALPAAITSAPGNGHAFFDSDVTADNFQALWGSKDGCGRNDLATMAAAGVNLVRLYDYNYQRGSAQWQTAGHGHIAFLDKAQSLGIKVIIPVSNYNFQRTDGANRPWSQINHTVTQIVESVKKNGVIHPAVHSFSVGNELDLDKYGMTAATLLPDAVTVATLLHKLAPEHYITIPISNAREATHYAWFKAHLPAELYQTRFYNAVQTFKSKEALLTDILQAYDRGNWGVPLVITELGKSRHDVGNSVDRQIDAVIGQASTARQYMDSHPNSLVKGFAVFEWQNSNAKRNGSSEDNAETMYGIHGFDGAICTSSTGTFGMWGDGGKEAWFHGDEKYVVDRLVSLRSAAHPEGLLKALSAYFK